MSSNAHIRSHRKPRSSSPNSLLRTGVTGGVLTTLAVAGAAGSANASVKSEAAAETAEIPTLGSALAPGSTQAAYATQSLAIHYELDAAQQRAEAEAQKKAEAETKRRAEAETKREAKAKAQRAAEARAARNSERGTPDSGTDSGTDSDSGTSADSSADSSAPSGNAAAVVEFAKAQIGKAYVMGSTGPNAYDCSGLTTAAFKQVGINLPRTSQDQSTFGTEVGLNNLQPGDLVYWGGKGTAYHIAIYLGGGQYVGAQNPSTGVAQHPLDWGGTPSGAVRVL